MSSPTRNRSPVYEQVQRDIRSRRLLPNVFENPLYTRDVMNVISEMTPPLISSHVEQLYEILTEMIGMVGVEINVFEFSYNDYEYKNPENADINVTMGDIDSQSETILMEFDEKTEEETLVNRSDLLNSLPLVLTEGGPASAATIRVFPPVTYFKTVHRHNFMYILKISVIHRDLWNNLRGIQNHDFAYNASVITILRSICNNHFRPAQTEWRWM